MINLTNTKKQHPAKTFSCGNLEVNVWKNIKSTNKNEAFISHSVQISKKYYDKETKEFKESSSIMPNELPKLILLLWKAFSWICEQKG